LYPQEPLFAARLRAPPSACLDGACAALADARGALLRAPAAAGEVPALCEVPAAHLGAFSADARLRALPAPALQVR